jgi:hypothetical protein
MSGSGAKRELNRTQKVEVTYNNGQILWKRMDRIEAEHRIRTEALVLHGGILLNRTFWGRLRWLFTGK